MSHAPHIYIISWSDECSHMTLFTHGWTIQLGNERATCGLSNARLQYADLMHTESADLQNLQVWHAGNVNGVHGLHRERPRGEMSHQLPLARHAC
jgi:hypothetical protein